MQMTNGRFTIRNAEENDAQRLAAWWNDGNVMAHAGFPRGVGTTAERVAQMIRGDSEDSVRHLIIEREGKPIGEMHYRNCGQGTAEIGIKICEASEQNKGYGKVLLSLLVRRLFDTMGYKRIVLSVNADNQRARHVYEALGFQMGPVHVNAWQDQMGNWQSSVDYMLEPLNFLDFLKADKRAER